ncbi:MAG: hypothetical protein H5T44_02905 [Thermoplasmatales archaeon]|nr:hypothetical protein [Thermoplasmatales archaeon]
MVDEEDEFRKIIKEMEKIFEEVFRDAIEQFSGEKNIEINEDDKKIYVTIELDASEEDIKVKAYKDAIEIRLKNGWTKRINLPCKINKKIKKTFKNGILDLEIEKI